MFHSSHNFSPPNSPFPTPKLPPHFRLDFDLKPSYDISAFTLGNVRETKGKIFASFCFVFFQYFSFIIGSVRITDEFGYFVCFSFLPMTQDGPYRSSPLEGSDQKKEK